MSRILTALLAVSLLTGCSVLSQLGAVIGTRATLADAEIKGFSGLVTPITGTATNPDGTTRVIELGCIIAVAVQGEKDLRQVLIKDEKHAALCKTLAEEVNSAITINGQADATGMITPTRVNLR